MLEQLRDAARGVQSTLREAALLAEIEKLREAIEATEQTLAMQKRRMENLAGELQKEPGHLARLAGSDAGAALAGMIRGMAGQPQRPPAAQQPPPQVIHVQPPRPTVGRPPGPQTIPSQPQRLAAAHARAAATPTRPATTTPPHPAPAAPAHPSPAAPAHPSPAAPAPQAAAPTEEPPAALPEHDAAEAYTSAAEEPHEAAEPGPPGEHDEFAAHERLLAEAIDTGRHALADLDQTITEVQDLARAGAWRIVKGIVSSHSPEHAKIGEVRIHAREVQELLGVFEHQVRGLHDEFGHRVDAADLADFARHFAEALAAGPHEEHLGHRAIEAARAAYHDVRRMCARLQLDAIALRAERAAQRRFARHRAG
jgi:hypothetical protein